MFGRMCRFIAWWILEKGRAWLVVRGLRLMIKLDSKDLLASEGLKINKNGRPCGAAFRPFQELAEKDARVMFRVRIRGATDPESLLSLFLDEDFPEDEDLPKSLRQEDPPPLLENFLKLDVDGNFVERCLNDLWRRGMQLTMMPVDISANLTTVQRS
ncbi:MAG: hypothetical protein Q9199_003585 [Rusavskia elegans]